MPTEIPKILIVNDNAHSLMAMVSLVSSWEEEISCEVITALSGQEALRQVLLNDFAAILLDVQMPDMDGFETAEAIHSRPRSASTPIIFLTAYLSDELNRFRGYQKGAVDYLFTPVIPEILKAKLTVFVGLARKNIELKLQAEMLDKRTQELESINAQLKQEIEERKNAETRSKTKDEFLAMLSHELRNPLSAISSAAALINLPDLDTSRAQKAGEVISRQTKHLNHIINDLLDLSRVISGKVELSTRPLDLSSLAETCIETLTLAGRADRHTISRNMEPAWVNGDPHRLEQIITNLLDNAIKYTPAGGQISIDVRAGNREVDVVVTDSGIGMSSELLPHIFDVFVQGEGRPDRMRGGLGIGLALVQQLTLLHGGKISAHSDGQGRGSTFVLRLPVWEEAAPCETQANRLTSRDAFRVLVIEDNVDAREMMSMLLTSCGHQVIRASDGFEGIRQAEAERPDIVFIDIGLPGMDGHEVAMRLKEMPTTSGIPLIALTGYGQPHDKQRALDAGFHAHLTKPADIERLTEAMTNCVACLGKA